MKLTGAEIFARVLIEQGVDTLFGYPGGAVLDLYDALYRHRDRIRHILSSHEQGAAHAADGYARSSGKTGVVLATSGPGATNLVTGIATAFMDSVPMVAITGNVATGLIGKDSFQEVYIAGITLPITKHNYVVQDVKDLAGTLREAFRLAGSGRKGPVLVDIPKDVQEQSCEYEPASAEEPAPAREADVAGLQQAAAAIAKAQRPVLYIGGGATDAGRQIRQLIEKTQIPAVWTMMAAGILDHADPMNLGMVGMHGKRAANLTVDQADCLIAIGTRFSDRVAMNPEAFARRAFRIQIDIDPSEVNKNVPVDLSLVGEAAQVLEQLLPHVENGEHAEWISQIRKWQSLEYEPTDDPKTLKPHQIMRMIGELAGPDTIITTDVGQHQVWAAQYIEHHRPRHFLTSGGLGTMGFGYGAAIGAKIANPGKPVVHLTSDGSFHMNMNEAATAVSLELPVITVILNNTVLGMVRQWQTVFYESRYSCTEPNRKTDYMKVAEGFGAKGFRCQTPDEFREAFTAALQIPGPVWIECRIDKDARALPMIPGGGTIKDIIIK